jgi:hypothetical protein
LVAEIAAMIESERAERPNAGNYGEGRGADTAGGQLPIVAYQRLLSEMSARLADMETALQHERAASIRLADALAREQQLRLLTAPESPSEPSFWQRIFARRKS